MKSSTEDKNSQHPLQDPSSFPQIKRTALLCDERHFKLMYACQEAKDSKRKFRSEKAIANCLSQRLHHSTDRQIDAMICASGVRYCRNDYASASQFIKKVKSLLALRSVENNNFLKAHLKCNEANLSIGYQRYEDADLYLQEAAYCLQYCEMCDIYGFFFFSRARYYRELIFSQKELNPDWQEKAVDLFMKSSEIYKRENKNGGMYQHEIATAYIYIVRIILDSPEKVQWKERLNVSEEILAKAEHYLRIAKVEYGKCQMRDRNKSWLALCDSFLAFRWFQFCIKHCSCVCEPVEMVDVLCSICSKVEFYLYEAIRLAKRAVDELNNAMYKERKHAKQYLKYLESLRHPRGLSHGQRQSYLELHSSTDSNTVGDLSVANNASGLESDVMN